MLYYLQLMVTSALEERSPHFCPTLPGKVSNFFYWSTWSHMLTDNWHYFTHDDYFILGMYSVILAFCYYTRVGFPSQSAMWTGQASSSGGKGERAWYTLLQLWRKKKGKKFLWTGQYLHYAIQWNEVQNLRWVSGTSSDVPSLTHSAAPMVDHWWLTPALEIAKVLYDHQASGPAPWWLEICHPDRMHAV